MKETCLIFDVNDRPEQHTSFSYMRSLSLSLSCVSQQPALLRPAGPDGGRTSSLPPLLRGGGVRQLGAAPARLLGPGTHPAPVGSGGSRQSPGVSQQPIRGQQLPAPAQPREPPAPLPGGPVVRPQRQCRRRPAATCFVFRRQGHLIEKPWGWGGQYLFSYEGF